MMNGSGVGAGGVPVGEMEVGEAAGARVGGCVGSRMVGEGSGGRTGRLRGSRAAQPLNHSPAPRKPKARRKSRRVTRRPVIVKFSVR